MSGLETAVDTVIGRCLGIRPEETVVVVADDATRSIGDALRAAAARAGADADAVLALMDPREDLEPTLDLGSTRVLERGAFLL